MIDKFDDAELSSFEYYDEVSGVWKEFKKSDFSISVGFPSSDEAAYPICTITIQDMVRKKYTILGYGDFGGTLPDNATYVKCADEVDLLKKFLSMLSENPMDVITGWNTTYFDVPYLVHRITSQISASAANRLSPVGKLTRHEDPDSYKKTRVTYTIHGTANFDYKELYDKFTFDPRESYSLDYISKFELGEAKLDFKKDHRSFWDMYHEDFDTFVLYNYRDVELVSLIDAKLRYIDLAFNLVYMAKCQLDDVYGTVKFWDALLYNDRLSRKIICPPTKHGVKQEYPGGFVGDPEPGLHRWIAVFDVASSYPNSIVSYNMSPETIVDDCYLPDELLELRQKYAGKLWNIDMFLDQDALQAAGVSEVLQRYSVCMAPNGQFFRTDIEGFIPKLIYEMFMERKGTKKEQKKVKEKISEIKKESGDTAELDNEFASLEARQMALKVCLNSFYGACANVYFRYFDLRIASGITMAGQTSARGVSKYIETKFPLVKNKYADTDSNFFNLEPLVEKRFEGTDADLEEKTKFCVRLMEEVISPAIAEFFDRLSKNLNMRRCTLSMEPECVSDVCMFLAKKKYAMKQVWVEGSWYLDKTKLKVRGIEIVRTSTPQFCRDTLKRAVELIFETQSRDRVVAFVDACKEKFAELDFAKQAFPRGVNGLEKYTGVTKSVPIHVRAALTYNREIEKRKLTSKYQTIAEGDKIKFAYVKTPNAIGTNVIAAVDVLPPELGLQVDVDEQFEKSYMSSIQSMFDSMGWKLRETQVGLDDFFS